MQFFDTIKQSICVWSWNYVMMQQRGSCCLMHTHSVMTTVAGITRRLCLARAQRGPLSHLQLHSLPFSAHGCPTPIDTRKFDRPAGALPRPEKGAGRRVMWGGLVRRAVSCDHRLGWARWVARPGPPSLSPRAASCRGAPRLALQRHFVNIT